MNKVWCLLCCLIPILGFGQHRTFYNKAHEKVDSSAGYDYSETVEKLAGGWRNVKRYFPNGNLRFEGTFSNYQIKGEKDVEEKLHQYYREDSSVLWFTEIYVNGKLQGESRTYYPSGELRRVEQFNKDTLVTGACFNQDGSAREFTPSQQAPSYPGGEAALFQHLSDNLKYPTYAFDHNIQGTAVVTFVVNKDGSVSDVELLKDPGGGCGEEAVRLVQSMARWNPGFAHDNPVKVRYSLPMKFKLEINKKKKKKKD